MLRISLAGAAVAGALLVLGIAPATAETAPSEKEKQRQELIAAFQARHKCLEPIFKDARLAPLREKAPPYGGEEPERKHLNDRSKPTPEHVALIKDYRARTQPCRQQWLDLTTAIVPAAYTAATKKFSSRSDAVHDALERQEIEWGRANATFSKIRKDYNREADRAWK